MTTKKQREFVIDKKKNLVIFTKQSFSHFLEHIDKEISLAEKKGYEKAMQTKLKEYKQNNIDLIASFIYIIEPLILKVIKKNYKSLLKVEKIT